MGKLGTLNEQDAWAIALNIENSEVVKRAYGEDAVLKHLKSDLSIVLKARDIPSSRTPNYKLIEGKARLSNGSQTFNGKIETPCRVACMNLHRLREVVKGDEINILDHIALLLPVNQKGIGLFTYQNGIQNSPTDFENMGNSILKNLLPEKPLCIGFYNQTNGIPFRILDDLTRFSNEWHLNASSIMIMRQMMISFYKLFTSYLSKQELVVQKTGLFGLKPKLLWTHIAHSEGALIAHEVLAGKRYSIFDQVRGIDKFLRDHLITLSYGGVAPIPDKVHFAMNTYSVDDVTMTFAKKYLDKFPVPHSNSDAALMELAKQLHSHPYIKIASSPDEIFKKLKEGTDKFYIASYPYSSTKNGHTVTIVKSKVHKSKQPTIEKDHAFAGETYQGELSENINLLRTKFRIYHSFAL